jgi:NAD(P)-dependent dehydrogenase (short-subunit alcohol dehydrogenase family)
MVENKVALVTGVSSDIGREIAQLLAERGARVFGTVRDHRSTASVAGVELIHMDATNDASVAEAVQSLLVRAGEIHAVVNNAGYALLGGLEETSLSEAQQQFDTNFFGVLRVTQAVLPSMRRLGYGRIINISSILGLLPGPYMGIYAASKHALEGYTETLDHEIRTFGIRAVLVEPAFTKTNLERNGKTALSTLDAYADQRRRVEEVFSARNRPWRRASCRGRNSFPRADCPITAPALPRGKKCRVEPIEALCSDSSVRPDFSETVSTR